MKFKIENREGPPIRETVRAALFYRGKFLILEKNADAINPASLEFPGGKIDNIAGKVATKEEQEQALITELQQETGINVPNLTKEKIDDFGVYFEAKTKDKKVRQSRYLVHLFLIRIPDTDNIVVRINETKNEMGKSEDNHANYFWVTPVELVEMATKLRENNITGKMAHPLSKNSRHIKKLLQVIDPVRDWEQMLKDMGLPSEIPTEQEKAAEAGIDLVSTETINRAAIELAAKLRKEDPSNLLGGFPNTVDLMISLVGDLRKEWIVNGISEKDIRLTIHASCVNGCDCVILSQNGGNKYHYNTKNILHYSRQEMMSKLRRHGLSFIEK